MQNGRDHQEREEKFATRVEQQERRDEEAPFEEAGVAELDRRAHSADPAPTEKAVEAERARHARERS